MERWAVASRPGPIENKGWINGDCLEMALAFGQEFISCHARLHPIIKTVTGDRGLKLRVFLH